MAKLEGITKLFSQLKAKVKEFGSTPSVIVGYTASYAVHVHEDMEMTHRVGQAKFLEQPARENAKEYGLIVRQAMARGVPLDKALLMAGLKLQRDSQKLVPVDTGNLRASAFTRLVTS